jgi:ribosomal protein S18 acetylase RimI-like enzyme
VIRRMTDDDVSGVVAIHLASFPAFFLSFLGPRFLRLLYSALVREPDAICFVSCDGAGKLTGFVTGVTRQSAFFRRLVKQDKWHFAFAAVGAAIRRPVIIPRLFRALRRPAEASNSSSEALLMSIGVSPTEQGQGLGRQLVAAFTEEIRRRGIASYCLTTDNQNNDAANSFYQNAGFVLQRSYVTREGRLMNEYLMQIR